MLLVWGSCRSSNVCFKYSENVFAKLFKCRICGAFSEIRDSLLKAPAQLPVFTNSFVLLRADPIPFRRDFLLPLAVCPYIQFCSNPETTEIADGRIEINLCLWRAMNELQQQQPQSTFCGRFAIVVMLTLSWRGTNLQHHRIISRCTNETISRCNYEYCCLAGICDVSLSAEEEEYFHRSTRSRHIPQLLLFFTHICSFQLSTFLSRHHLFLHSTALHHRIYSRSMSWWTRLRTTSSRPLEHFPAAWDIYMSLQVPLWFSCAKWEVSGFLIFHPLCIQAGIVSTFNLPTRRCKSWREIGKIQ